MPNSTQRLVRLVTLLALVLCGGLSAVAQFTSSVQGTVTDATGAVIARADVTLVNTDTNISKTIKTSASGAYFFTGLAAGPYTVEVKQEGFAPRKTSVLVTADATAGVNFRLEVATAAAQVEVTSVVSDLNTEETRTQYTLDEQEMKNLPNQNSATLGLVRFAPGVTGVVEGQDNLNENRSLPEGNANGRDSAANLFTLDNVPISSSQSYASSFGGNVGGQVTFVPNMSSIGEVALQTTTFAVSYGSAASMVVAFNSKSGVNKWHGIADESYGDGALNAYGFDVSHNSGGSHRHVYSFGLGGPIRKDNTFIWGSIERRADLEPAGSGAAQIFTPEFSTFIQNPANDPNQISVTAFLKNAPNTRAEFIPSSSDKTAAQYFGGCTNGATTTSFNTPCSMMVTKNAIEAGHHFVNGKNYTGRLDQNFRQGNDRVFAYYYGMDQNSDSESIAPAFDGLTPTSGQHFASNFTHQFSANLVNQASYAYTHFKFNFTTTPHSANMVQLPFLFLNLGVSNFTRFVPFTDEESQSYFRDSLSIIKGNHFFELGAEVARNLSNDDRTGIYTRPLFYLWFTPQDFFNDQLDLYNISDYYSGKTGQHIGAISAATNLRGGVYAQDAWKVRPNLTINYGIRWDNLGNPQPWGNTVPFANLVNNAPSGRIAGTDYAKSLNVQAVNQAFGQSQWANFDPRVGFAWAPFKRSYSTVLRGGVGLYQDLFNLENVAGQVTSNPPGIISYVHCCGGTVGYGSNNDASQGYGFSNIPTSIPAPTYLPDGAVNVGADTNIGDHATVNGTVSNFKPQRNLLWDLSIEHQFAAKIIGAATYTGSHGFDLSYVADLNRPLGSYMPDGKGGEIASVVNSDFNVVRPYMSGLVSNFAALTLALRQNWHGYQWQASYNWSHDLADPNGNAPTDGIVDNYNPHAQYGNALWDVRHSFKLSGLMPIPVHSHNAVVQTLFGGWNFNNAIVAQSGEPFTVYYGNQKPATDFAHNNGAMQIPDYNGTKHSWSRQAWKTGIFSPTYSEFTAPTGAIGNQGENSFRNAGYFTWDANLAKTIDLRGFSADQKSHLTLRVDGFNIPNRFNPSPIELNNLGNPGGQQIDGGTGPTTTGGFQARILQLGARFEF